MQGLCGKENGIAMETLEFQARCLAKFWRSCSHFFYTSHRTTESVCVEFRPLSCFSSEHLQYWWATYWNVGVIFVPFALFHSVAIPVKPMASTGQSFAVSSG